MVEELHCIATCDKNFAICLLSCVNLASVMFMATRINLSLRSQRRNLLIGRKAKGLFVTGEEMPDD
ncbi:hypothetical protein J2W40_003948 [Sphingobium xenophagum]|uniref:Uncharacterized protein n=1 Tax=Sphingobium xenophagum TaxID=121428 RepID=A0ABU1X688_SPHXE|nr:hypothetical protein [Sphingobium xenophagum]